MRHLYTITRYIPDLTDTNDGIFELDYSDNRFVRRAELNHLIKDNPNELVNKTLNVSYLKEYISIAVDPKIQN